MGIPKIEISAEKIADKVLDEIEFKGKNIREWAEYLIRNADDLISRQAAIECLKTKIAEIFFKETAEKNVEKWLNELPTVQPEQRTATFYVDSEGYERCSACNEHESGMRYFNFCPNCGAKMEEEK